MTSLASDSARSSVNHRPHLLLINQYYEPDIAATGVLMTQLCEGLVEYGFDLTVVTAQPNYTTSDLTAAAFEIRNGVEVHRISLGRSVGRVSMRSRLGGYFKFLYRSRRLANRLGRIKRPDIVVTASNPPLIERVGRAVAKKFDAAHVHVVHDIHPDVLIAAKQMRLPPFAAKLWRSLSNGALQASDRIVVLSENMKKNLVKTKRVQAARVEVINLWAVPEIVDLPDPSTVRSRFGIPEENLLAIHTGNIGVVQGLNGVVEAASLLQDDPVTILLVGDGAAKPELESQVSRLGLKNVRFLPFLPEEDYLKMLAASDVCIVTLRPGMERFSLPSKTFTYLAAGKPIVGLLQPGNDVSAILEQYDVGWNSTTSEEFAHVLKAVSQQRNTLGAIGVNCRALYLDKYSRSAGVETYARMFKSLLPRSTGNTS